jgi:hypothetical protein
MALKEWSILPPNYVEPPEFTDKVTVSILPLAIVGMNPSHCAETGPGLLQRPVRRAMTPLVIIRPRR